MWHDLHGATYAGLVTIVPIMDSYSTSSPEGSTRFNHSTLQQDSAAMPGFCEEGWLQGMVLKQRVAMLWTHNHCEDLFHLWLNFITCINPYIRNCHQRLIPT